MACNSGCCGSPNEFPSADRIIANVNAPASSDFRSDSTAVDTRKTSSPVSTKSEVGDESCNDGCCADSTGAADVAAIEPQSCCGESASQGGPNNSCCEVSEPSKPEECSSVKVGPMAKDHDQLQDSCCGSDGNESSPQPVQEGSCEQSCCALPAIAPGPLPAPDCCQGKTSPCCDTDCIDRLALRECQSKGSDDCCDGGDQDHESDIHGNENSKACRGHWKNAYSRYKAQLDAIGCICRALIALGEESCCPKPKTGSAGRARQRRSIDSKSSSILSSSSVVKKLGASRRRTVNKDTSRNRSCTRGCCASSSVPPLPPQATFDICQESNGCGTGCCEVTPTIRQDDCVTDCCNDRGLGVPGSGNQVNMAVRPSSEPEKHTSSSEQVILAISGMTCTGCETKLHRTLAALEPVSNLKTSLVLSQAKFDVDLDAMTIDGVIKHLERTTEFKCEKITSRGSSLDLICSVEAVDIANAKWPGGVTGVRVVDRTTVHVEFDAKLVGARDLFEKGWDVPMSLAPPMPDQSLEAGARHVRNVGLSTLLSIALTIPVLVMAWAPLPEREIAYGSASLALATIIQVVIAGPFYPKALKAMIFSRVIEMDLLIVLSTSAAYIFSVVAFAHLVVGNPLSTGEFFETSTLLISLIMVGRYAAALARQKAVESISIRSLQAKLATLCEDDGSTRDIDTRLLQFGDIFQVAPDSGVPTDGTVLSGVSEVNESMMTGESRPVAKEVGSVVIAGSINGPGLLKVRLTRLPDDNTISIIAGMVDEAKLSKPKIQETADRVATYFVPVVVALASITFGIWIAVGMAVQGKSGSEATIQAVTYAITVLIVSCPCAIGLAVPIVIVMASGIAAERGVVFKSAEGIELGYKTKHVVFDKTGTLTEGKLKVTRGEYIDGDADQIKPILLALAESTKHPVSVAIADHLKKDSVDAASDMLNPRAVVGKGVEGMHHGKTVRAGNSRWLGLSSNQLVQEVLDQGCTVFCFVIDDTLKAVYGLKDTIRVDASTVVLELQNMGISVHLVSGDDDGAVREVASQLGIPAMFTRSRCSPSDKQEYIKGINALDADSQSSQQIVMFCGDGTNDAPALAQATIGVHVNEGTEVAKSAADVVLTRPNLSGILVAITISQKAIHRIAFNFGWSFVYNLFAVLLAAGAFVNARIPPAYAGLGELVSVLPVIVAGFLLKYARI